MAGQKHAGREQPNRDRDQEANKERTDVDMTAAVVMVLDTEATDMKAGVLLQLAYELVDTTSRRITKRFSSFVSGQPRDAVVCPRATRTHGITTAKADAEGRPLEDVLREAIRDAQGCALVVAHNAQADHALLVRECSRVGLRWPFVPMQCTQLLSAPLCRLPFPAGTSTGAVGQYKPPRLVEAHALLVGGTLSGDLHDAAVDVEACRALWFAIMDRHRHRRAPPTAGSCGR